MTTPCQGAGGTGTRYTYAQLEGLWINAGGPASVAPIAAAVALAESGGCTSALNLTDNGGTQTSVGLWQTSNGTHSYPSAWTTAAGNAAEAVAKYNGAGNTFSPWGTYTSGAYTRFINNGTTPDTNVPTAATGNTPGTSGSSNSTCLIAAPSANLIFFTVGGQCLLGKPQARAIIGAGVLVGGLIMGGVGLLVLAAFGLKSSGAGKAAGRAMELGGAALAVVPGAELAGAAIATGGARTRGAASSPHATRARSRRETRRAPAAAQDAQDRHTARQLAGTSPRGRKPAQRGTKADEQGTSPEFRRMFLGGDR